MECKNVQLTLSTSPNHHRLWSMHSGFGARILRAGTKVRCHIQFHPPMACAVFDSLQPHCHTINEHMEAAIKYKTFVSNVKYLKINNECLANKLAVHCAHLQVCGVTLQCNYIQYTINFV